MTGRSKGLVALAGAIVCMVVGQLVAAPTASAQSDTADDAAQLLADTYAPIIQVVAQSEACDTDGEAFLPQAVDAILDNPEIVLRQVGSGNPVVKVAPGAADLHELGEGFFIDFPGSALEPECIYETDFRRYTRDLRPTVYAHLVTQPDHPDQLALQYWFYWYYNDWNNKHESDWEGIQLLFDTGSVDEALERGPVSIGYAQHEGGERAAWDDDKLRREGTRPVVYPSAGSHASYFEDDLHLGRGASEGFGCDTTIGPSTRVDPDVVVLPDSVDDPDDPLAWVSYGGRWGERQGGPFNGPTGPASKPRWTHPVDWHDELRSASVLMPGGDSSASGVITTFCDVVEWGAGRLISLTVSPVRLLITLFLGVWIASRVVRRTDWSVVSPQPLADRRRAGQIIRASFRLLGRSSTIRWIGLAFAPVSVLAGVVARVVASLPFFGELLDLSGTDGLAGLFIAIVLAASASLLAFVGINAAVAEYFRLEEAGHHDVGPVEALRGVWSRVGALFSAFARSYAAIVVLAITVIGLPFAVYLLVRVQFAPHVVMVEQQSGAAALTRSWRLVARRWWHTAGMTVFINASVAGVTLLIGLLLLVIFAGLPLWLFSAVLAIVTATISPVAAVAMTLLYGDALAVAEDAEDERHVDLDDAIATGSSAARSGDPSV